MELVRKYLFLKDPIGCEFGSWSHKFLEKFRNARKYRKRVHGDGIDEATESPDADETKKAKKLDYDVSPFSSPSESDLLAMKKELQNERPRDEILIELMKSTFTARKCLVKAKHSVADIVEVYPALKQSAILENEMILFSHNKIKDTFTRNWRMWIPAIIEYTKKLKKKPLVDIHSSVTSELDPEMQQELALKLLVGLFLNHGKDVTVAMKEIFAEYDISHSLEEISVEPPPKNAPRIVKLEGGQKSQYFVLVEQDVLTEVSSISQAIYIWFCTHYIFDMEYASVVSSVGLFFQDVVFSLSNGGSRKSNYKTILGDLKLYLKDI